MAEFLRIGGVGIWACFWLEKVDVAPKGGRGLESYVRDLNLFFHQGLTLGQRKPEIQKRSYFLSLRQSSTNFYY